MYLEFFGLREFPFRLTPDSDFLFMSSAHSRAKAYMDYTVWNREGFVVITGDIGCGKTTLLQKLLSELSDDNVLVAKIFQTQLNEVEFLQALLVEFGVNPFTASKVELLDTLNTFLIENFRKLKQLVLIIDDAHNLSPKVLEEVRMLSGLETSKEKILHVILVGQPQLNDALESPELEQLLQRVRLRFHLKPLTEKETADYIAHRMQIAGAERADIFDIGTVPVIYEYAGGVPRLINTLCDTALACAYADNLTTITKEVIRIAAEELQWLPYAKRINAKRLKERAGRSAKSTGFSAEQERQIENISSRLNQLDVFTPELASLSVKMGNIESLLSRILDLMQQREAGSENRKLRPNRR